MSNLHNTAMDTGKYKFAVLRYVVSYGQKEGQAKTSLFSWLKDLQGPFLLAATILLIRLVRYEPWVWGVVFVLFLYQALLTIAQLYNFFRGFRGNR